METLFCIKNQKCSGRYKNSHSALRLEILETQLLCMTQGFFGSQFYYRFTIFLFCSLDITAERCVSNTDLLFIAK